MIADAPHYVSTRQDKETGADGEQDEVLAFFQSNL